MAGYSYKSLVQKLGYKPGDSLQLVDEPAWFKDYVTSEEITLTDSSPTWLHGFFTSYDQVANFLQFVELETIQKGLWLCWPKKSSGAKTDVNEQTFRDLVLPLGWVDVKVAAIDETWSGLLFYRRKT